MPMRIFVHALWVGWLVGCSTTTDVSITHPPANQRAAQIKSLAVLPFENDQIGIANAIEARLVDHQVAGKYVFHLATRQDLRELLEEQRLQVSGLVDEQTAVTVGNLIGVRGLVTGSVDGLDTVYRQYYETRVQCANKGCTETYDRGVACTEMTSMLQTTVRWSDVELGDLILAKQFVVSDQYDACIDDSDGLPPEAEVYAQLSADIIDQLMREVAPFQTLSTVRLLDEPDIKYSETQEALLENGLEYLKAGRVGRADGLFTELVSRTDSTCYVAAYNLGVVKEQQGLLDQAEQLYELADHLSVTPNRWVNEAMLRIELQLSNRARLERQL